ncbi:hypothetical protein ABFS82_13G104800 [Erythranthe guttata]
MAKKMFPNMAADFASSESLSFAGLVCIQEQKKEHPKMQKQETDFEFRGSNLNNNLSPDKLHSNGRISTYQHQPAPNKIILENLLTDIPSRKKRSDIKQQSKHKSNSRETNSQVKRRASGKKKSKSFSQKLLSFTTPCRDCRSLEPTPRVKEQTLQ